MIKIGITGTIGSGKSYVANLLNEYDIPVLDLDKVAKEVRNNEAKKEIIAYFGDAILTEGNINPKKLSNIIFENDTARKKLESFIHPFVLEKMNDFFISNKTYEYVAVEQAILFELGWEKYFDQIWLVDCSKKIAIDRLIKFRGYEKATAEAIMNTQFSNIEKRKLADYVIINNDGKDSLYKQIDKILKKE
ncbi:MULTISPECIES: dephospho-CoA kinase [unclassified Breznakia]|uniref:dephospho-CoA kinase n=1 Tax=unclassified Breznakia TaxID=2623764 RepID=UPI002406ADD7|nr:MULTISPECIES: dephospho-CoA kinase [unclassified Breznakia]MDF9838706.1 dephospho-CoA kinase [Breznakia sp. PFB2-8]MDF9860737.1 dephospho-CoA kinase [Breznakia sp. PH5-24]